MLGRIKLKKINSYIVLVQNPNFIKNTDHTKKKKYRPAYSYETREPVTANIDSTAL